MQMKRMTFLALSFLCLAVHSCGKDDNGSQNVPGGDPSVEKPGPFDKCDLYGIITDAATGEGIADVPVTDGFTYTKTDSKGKYGLNRNAMARKVYYCTPEGYEINLDPVTGRPSFFSAGILSGKDRFRQDFKLKKLDAPENHVTIIAVGDPQCADAAAVKRFSEETVADIVATAGSLKDGNVYAVTLGDIIYDSNDMWGPCASAMSSAVVSGRRLPFFQCIGNHDHDATVPETGGDAAATLRFVDMFGPTDYSFDRAGVHVVVMDNISVKSISDSDHSNGKKWGEYSAKFDDDQERWLSADLDMVRNPEKKTLILCMHAPMSDISSSRSARFLDMMTRFKEAHIFSGHTHINENVVYSDYTCRGGTPVYEHTHSTACGMWWKSNSDTSGSPAGYSVYSVSGGSLDDWYLKGAHGSAAFQIRAYDGDEIYPAAYGSRTSYDWFTAIQPLTSTADIQGNPSVKGCLIADVFNADDKYWTVELFVEDSKAGDFKMVQADAMPNICHAAWAYNEKSRRTVNVRQTLTNRLWYIKPPVSPSELKNWEIVATQTIPGSGVKHVYKCSSLTGKGSYDY